MSKRPRGRSFQRGQSGNPGGRPKRPATVEAHKIIADLKELAREHTEEAFNKVVAIMRSPKTPPACALGAATQILDRGWGKPKEFLEAKGEVSFIDIVRASLKIEVDKPPPELGHVYTLEEHYAEQRGEEDSDL